MPKPFPGRVRRDRRQTEPKGPTGMITADPTGEDSTVAGRCFGECGERRTTEGPTRAADKRP
jgi:hypothetical protein